MPRFVWTRSSGAERVLVVCIAVAGVVVVGMAVYLGVSDENSVVNSPPSGVDLVRVHREINRIASRLEQMEMQFAARSVSAPVRISDESWLRDLVNTRIDEAEEAHGILADRVSKLEVQLKEFAGASGMQTHKRGGRLERNDEALRDTVLAFLGDPRATLGDHLYMSPWQIYVRYGEPNESSGYLWKYYDHERSVRLVFNFTNGSVATMWGGPIKE